MDLAFFDQLTEKCLQGEPLSDQTCLDILKDPTYPLLPLLHSAYRIRQHFFANKVKIHIINNAQNGHCPEDCNYCAQAKTSKADIAAYPLKSEDEILAEAKAAWKAGAFRYCMVFAGRGPNAKRTSQLADLIRKIKDRYPIEVCVSPGLMEKDGLQQLKDAGLDRFNHNLNTSADLYRKICTTHTYQDRLNTLQAARDVGLEVCSGMIAGMGETPEDIITVARRLASLNARSIPVNFLIPIPGNTLDTVSDLTPEYCLRILCLFRFLNPSAEIRAAAGREGHLRSMEALCLYPANSIFLEGYLNTRGSDRSRVFSMIHDAGFEIDADDFESETPLAPSSPSAESYQLEGTDSLMKTLSDLKPLKKQ